MELLIELLVYKNLANPLKSAWSYVKIEPGNGDESFIPIQVHELIRQPVLTKPQELYQLHGLIQPFELNRLDYLNQLFDTAQQNQLNRLNRW